jgi:hypothetical protein
MVTKEELLADNDWIEAFVYASFTVEDIEEIYDAQEGANEGPDWIIWGKLKSGNYFVLSAGCDCRASGWSYVASTEHELVRMHMTFDIRKRFYSERIENALSPGRKPT